MAKRDAAILAGLRAQLEERRALLVGGAARVGWKVALGIEEVANRPVMGYLTSATQLDPGATHSAAGAGELCVDAELAVEVGGGRFAAALELVDLGQARGSAESVLRANVLHRAFVLGAPGSEPTSEARVRVGGEQRAHGVVDFDLAERIEAVRYWLDRLGEHLEPGDWIITGSIVQVRVAPGDEVEVELPGLGCLAASITP